MCAGAQAGPGRSAMVVRWRTRVGARETLMLAWRVSIASLPPGPLIERELPEPLPWPVRWLGALAVAIVATTLLALSALG
jgi:hypothetical protein